MIFHIALKDLKITFRDRKALMFLILMPIVLIMIIGASFGSMFENELKISKFTVGVVNNDSGFMSQVFINKVLREGLSDTFETFVVDGKKAGKMLDDKKAPSVIYIPEDFTSNILDNKPVKISIKSNVDSQIKQSIVKGVSESFSKNISLSYAGANAGLVTFKSHNINIPMEDVKISGMNENTAVMFDLQKKISSEMVKFSDIDQKKNKVLTGLQYYSAAMLIMFMLFGANSGTRMIIEERESKTLGRIMSARASKTTLIIGKFLGLLFICFVQALILIIFTRLVYGVDWGSSIPGTLLVTVCATFAAAAFGMFLAALAKTPGAADGLGQLFIQTFTLVSGSMIPIYVMPAIMKKAAKITLNWWAVTGYQDLMLGKGVLDILPYMGVLIIMGIGYLAIGIWRFRVE